MASAYVLFSPSAKKFYIGSTKDFIQRFDNHITKEFPDSFTAKYPDWELFHEISDISITTAKKIEMHLKRMKSRKYLLDLKQYPEMTLKLIKKYL